MFCSGNYLSCDLSGEEFVIPPGLVLHLQLKVGKENAVRFFTSFNSQNPGIDQIIAPTLFESMPLIPDQLLC